MHRAVGNDGFLYHLQALFHAVQSLIEDACHRSAGVSAHFLCGFHTSAAQCTVDVFEQLRVVGRGHVQIDDPLYAQGKAEDQSDQNDAHELRSAFNEFGLDDLLEGRIFSYFCLNDFFHHFLWSGFFHCGG